eukprot:scaffold8923_cov67-Phaeocystis_antarctica.AAC.7
MSRFDTRPRAYRYHYPACRYATSPPNFPLVAGPSPHPPRHSRRQKEACSTAHATHTEGKRQREGGRLARTMAGSGGGVDMRGTRGGASRHLVYHLPLDSKDGPDGAPCHLDHLEEEHAPAAARHAAEDRECPDEAQAEVEGAEAEVERLTPGDDEWGAHAQAAQALVVAPRPAWQAPVHEHVPYEAVGRLCDGREDEEVVVHGRRVLGAQRRRAGSATAGRAPERKPKEQPLLGSQAARALLPGSEASPGDLGGPPE